MRSMKGNGITTTTRRTEIPARATSGDRTGKNRPIVQGVKPDPEQERSRSKENHGDGDADHEESGQVTIETPGDGAHEGSVGKGNDRENAGGNCSFSQNRRPSVEGAVQAEPKTDRGGITCKRLPRRGRRPRTALPAFPRSPRTGGTYRKVGWRPATDEYPHAHQLDRDPSDSENHEGHPDRFHI